VAVHSPATAGALAPALDGGTPALNETLALIPARSGGHLRRLSGHPVVAWGVAAGVQAGAVTRTVCATDDPAVADAARRYGAEAPFLLPAAATPGGDRGRDDLRFALRWLDEHEGWRPEAVVRLDPTRPVRLPGQVDRAVALLRDRPDADGVRGVCPVPADPGRVWRLGDGTGPFLRPLGDDPGAAPPVVCWETGGIDVWRTGALLDGRGAGGRFLPLPLEPFQAAGVDDEDGLRLAGAVVDRFDCVRPSPSLPWGRVRLLVLDVDGTLTPGTMYYTAEGESLKRFHTHDGQGIKTVARLGVRVAIITGEPSGFTTARASKLGITEVSLGIADKLPVFLDLCRRVGVTPAEVAYVGDDVGDVPPLAEVGRAGGAACAVADARPEVLSVANFVCPSRGGHGAVRDVCDRIAAAAPRADATH